MLNCEWTIRNPVARCIGSESPLSGPQKIHRSGLSSVDASVQIDGVKDPLCELLELGSGALRLLLQSLIVFPKPFNLCLQFQFLFSFLKEEKNRET